MNVKLYWQTWLSERSCQTCPYLAAKAGMLSQSITGNTLGKQKITAVILTLPYNYPAAKKLCGLTKPLDSSAWRKDKWLTLECFCLQNLATCLVLKLIILAQEVVTEGTPEDSTSWSDGRKELLVNLNWALKDTGKPRGRVGMPLTMIPHAAFTLNAIGISQRANTGMSAQTFPAVAHPSLTEVTYCPLLEKTQWGWRVNTFHVFFF